MLGTNSHHKRKSHTTRGQKRTRTATRRKWINTSKSILPKLMKSKDWGEWSIKSSVRSTERNKMEKVNKMISRIAKWQCASKESANVRWKLHSAKITPIVLRLQFPAFSFITRSKPTTSPNNTAKMWVQNWLALLQASGSKCQRRISWNIKS